MIKDLARSRQMNEKNTQIPTTLVLPRNFPAVGNKTYAKPEPCPPLSLKR
jgi:hypothetical protein